MNKQQSTSAAPHCDTTVVSQSAMLRLLADYWEQAAEQQHAVSIFIIDIDRFDSLPKKTPCFRLVVDAIAKALHRQHDCITAISRKKILLLTTEMSFKQATQLAERLHRAVAELTIEHPDSATGYLTVSIGHSTYNPSNSDGYGVLDLLNTVLKHNRSARRAGGNCSRSRLHSQLLK